MKRIFALLLALTALLSLAACGTEPAPATDASEVTSEATTAPAEVTLTAGELLETLKTQLGESYGCDAPEETERTMAYYGLTEEMVESVVSECSSMSSVNMDQAVVVKAKEGHAEEVAAALQNGFNQKAGYAQMYSMDLFRINETRLFVSGNYVALLTLGNPGDREADEETQAKFAAEEGKKVDAAWAGVFGEAAENQVVIPEPAENGGMRPGVRPRG